MKDDFMEELGYLALATRLKRISDAMVHSGRQMYKSLGLDIEPNWYLIFKLLDRHGTLSVTEIAGKLHFSHPSVITLIKKMKGNGYLESFTDKQDSRKQQVQLSAKAKQNLPQLEKIWEAGTLGVSRLFDPKDDFLGQLEKIERQLNEKDFRERTLNELTP